MPEIVTVTDEPDEVIVTNEGGVSVVTVVTPGPQGPAGDTDLLAPVALSGLYDDLTGKPEIPDVTGKADTLYVDARDTAVASSAQSALVVHTSQTDNPHSVTKGQVGLGDVDNTSDADKPLSTATSTALATKVDKVAGKVLSSNDYTDVEKAKVAGISAGATQNATDASLRDRTTHTGAQPISSITSLQGILDAKAGLTYVNSQNALDEKVSNKGAPDGYASLDSSGKLTASQLPSITKSTVGLGNVDNTADTAKPVSVAQQTALDAKASTSLLSTNGKGYINHGATAGTARPSGFISIEWHGTIAPTNATTADTWIDES